jgi:hypothetical protein
MKTLGAALLFLLLSTPSQAELAAIQVPDTGWSVSFEAPPLSKKTERRSGGDFSFKANSGRFNVSFFAEVPNGEGATHQDCYRFYWPLASKNSMIAKETISVAERPEYVRVQYDVVVDLQGKPVRQRNANYYVAFGGKWIDVHISVDEPTPDDEKIFTDFDKSLKFGASKS